MILVYRMSCSVVHREEQSECVAFAQVCPTGRSSDGLPLSVQVVGGKHCDCLTIAVAAQLERALGGWIRP